MGGESISKGGDFSGPREATPELLAQTRDPAIQCRSCRMIEAIDLLVGQGAGKRRRRDSGGMQTLVGMSVADPGEQLLRYSRNADDD